MVVSELFGNAVMHGPADGRVLVGDCLWREGARLIVCDGGGPGMPRLVYGSQLAEGGRGLRVVDSLAARWGSFSLAVPWRCGAISGSRARWAWRRLGLAAPGLVRVRPVLPGRPVAAVGPGTLDAVGHDERAAERPGSGLRLGLSPACGDVVPDRVLVRCGLHRCHQLRRRGEATR